MNWLKISLKNNKMKRVVFILMLLPLFATCQKLQGTIHFLDGTSISGTVKVASGDIKYWASPDAKPDTYDYTGATSVTMTTKNGEQVRFEYVYFDFQKKPILLKVEMEGYLTLYSDSSSYYTGAGVGMGFQSSSTYYLKKRGEKLGQWFICYGYIPKIQLPKVIDKYFNDCKVIQEKYHNWEFKKKDFREIVNYYNQNCAPKE
jgi:hypothetical protein